MLPCVMVQRNPPSDAHEPVRAQRVLVVDDSADTAELLRAVVERAGYVPRIASSARDALATAAEFRPHVALIDIGLPDMDGYKLTKLLREQPELSACRFIAVTGHTSASAVARSIAARSFEGLTYGKQRPLAATAGSAALGDRSAQSVGRPRER